MIGLKFSINLRYEAMHHAGDFTFNIHGAQTPRQTIVGEQLPINQPVEPVVYSDPTYGCHYMRLKAEPGLFTVHYDATVDIDQLFIAIDAVDDLANGLMVPRFCTDALSTHGEPATLQ